jgi:signal peptide peptidase SppA
MSDDPKTGTAQELIADLAWALELESRTWAILPETFLSFSSLENRIRSLDITSEDLRAAADAARPRGRPPAINGEVQTIDLKGVLTPNVSLFALIFGLGSSISSFRVQLAEAANNPDIGAIVINVDSPGGVVDLIPEIADEVAAAAKQKPVVAVANTLIASAAYWIASQATEIVVTPSGEVGSIGVFTEHRDISGALELMGIKPTLISAGKYKIETNPYSPLSEEARTALQQGVDDFYSMFVKAVATGRQASVADVRNGYGEGRVLTAKRAVDAGLADRVDTLENVVSGLQRRSRTGSTNGLGAESEGVQYTAEDRGRLAAMAGVLEFHSTQEDDQA